MMTKTMDELCVITILTLAVDSVQRANSGHRGTPMALAPAAYCLWQRFLRFAPSDPIWPNRDRFVPSAGHASMLLYAMLHLTGVRAVNPKYETLGEPAVTLEDISQVLVERNRRALRVHPGSDVAAGLATLHRFLTDAMKDRMRRPMTVDHGGPR